jgi:hypothetical protein
MKMFRLKICLIALATLLFVGLNFASSQQSAADAPTPGEVAAEAYCASIKGTSSTDDKQRDACNTGYIAGYDGDDKTITCKVYSDSLLTKCDTSFDAGQKAEATSPDTVGKAGATAMQSKSATCSKYTNSADKATCDNAYDARIKSMAQAAGEAAGKAGKASPCASLGFGGSGAKAECDKSYKTGVNEAGQASNHSCGGVATYFDFGAACTGTSTDAGGSASPIIALGLVLVSWVTALVGVGVVGGIVYGGFLYLTAQDNSGQTQKGVTIIVNSVVALIVWVFAYALINFIIPGGLFNG